MKEILGYLLLPWILIAIGSYLGPNPPKPEITYYELPFCLEYQINEQTKIINDTLKRKYYVSVTENGKYPDWKEYFVSGKKRMTLLKISYTQEIYFPINILNYYQDLNSKEKQIFSNAIFYDSSDEVWDHEREISAEELLSKYKIKIISLETSTLITNKTKKSKQPSITTDWKAKIRSAAILWLEKLLFILLL